MDVIPALRKSRQKDHHETMGYIVNIRPTELHGETLSQKTKNKANIVYTIQHL